MAHAARYLGRNHRGCGRGDFGDRGAGMNQRSDPVRSVYIQASFVDRSATFTGIET